MNLNTSSGPRRSSIVRANRAPCRPAGGRARQDGTSRPAAAIAVAVILGRDDRDVMSARAELEAERDGRVQIAERAERGEQDSHRGSRQ